MEDRQIEYRDLPCKLTDVERMEKAKALAGAITEINELEDQKKAVTSDYKAKIDGLNAMMQRLSGQVSSGLEVRRVECIWEFDYALQVKCLVRTDTGESLVKKQITTEEAQNALSLESEEE